DDNQLLDSTPTRRSSDLDVEAEIWREVIDTDLTGIFYSMKYEIPAMLANGSGAIVNMSSANGLVGLAGMAAYTAAKHGVIGLTRSEEHTSELQSRENLVC